MVHSLGYEQGTVVVQPLTHTVRVDWRPNADGQFIVYAQDVVLGNGILSDGSKDSLSELKELETERTSFLWLLGGDKLGLDGITRTIHRLVSSRRLYSVAFFTQRAPLWPGHSSSKTTP
jgi:hypothetical protein